MMGKNLEICLNADDHINLINNVKTAFKAGASRIELCGAMHLAGLSPTPGEIETAAKALPSNGELLVMVRPIAEHFNVDAALLKTMTSQITRAAQLGATGVVFGAIANNELDVAATAKLVECAQRNQLATTFHRAFDCITNSRSAIKMLTNLGVDRILSNGTHWADNSNVMHGLKQLQSIIADANGQIEIVIGGGVTANNAHILWQLGSEHLISLHAYSGVLNSAGLVDPLLINAILQRSDNEQSKHD
ncbi:copper homeostasis protein CutC [Pseudoalteromonas sp. KG3]|uniref:Copper homeostasis protein cutC homolog n=1 Tax=Pseudoalteromonas prydzensis TaxID=182141 RepID=A0ABR9FNF2_9GAMM|nr:MULTISPECIES: copper homeostasis protein CutC [Pseudoalteromonas]MBE0458356.1 copper homeostasis protein CutC [Pseudoalteromonas prydzensis]WKD26256.1 copper homeostasis protein CutC [Pseudoalteromonas sp. KG3]